ncbi:MAG: hypothetical protein ACK56F_31105 [bacterium]
MLLIRILLRGEFGYFLQIDDRAPDLRRLLVFPEGRVQVLLEILAVIFLGDLAEGRVRVHQSLVLETGFVWRVELALRQDRRRLLDLHAQARLLLRFAVLRHRRTGLAGLQATGLHVLHFY